MKAQPNAHYCCVCNKVFRSTYPNPERCSMCGSVHWDELKKHTDNGFDFYQEDDEFLAE